MQERMLGIVQEEAEPAELSGAVADRIHVIWTVVIAELRDRAINIAGEKDSQYVVDEIVHIEQVFVAGVGRAVRVQSLDFEIFGVVEKPVSGGLPEAQPGIEITVGREDG